jgi:tryptophanyl-tRNA synthetase
MLSATSYYFILIPASIYSDLKYLGGHFLLNAWEFSKSITFNQVRGAFGFDSSTNIGRCFFPSLQCVASFATSYPDIWGDDPKSDLRSEDRARDTLCLIPMAIDQDPYFRLVRENAHRMRVPCNKPALIHSKFLTALQGPGGKMSSSNPNSAIFMSDTPKQIKTKINKAFSGGQETLELHQKLGGNPDVDVPYQYLTYFEEDDEKLKKMAEEYKKGTLLTGDMKKECITMMQGIVKNFQEKRAKISDELLMEFMEPRRLEWKGNQNVDEEKNKAWEEAKKKAKGKEKKGKGKGDKKKA